MSVPPAASPTECPSCRATLAPGAALCANCATARTVPLPSIADAVPTALESARGGTSAAGARGPALAPGTLLDGKYEVRRRLGHGGFGDVYLVRHTILQRELALKTLHPLLGSDPSHRQRFFREARILMDLSHPNIVAVRDVGEWDGGLYLVLDYCAGETLQAVLKRDGRLSARAAAGLALPILRALDHAHAHGIVHRDLKPANLIVTPAVAGRPSEVKVLDFGIAKVFDPEAGGAETGNLTGAGVAIGTLHYMSPEQAGGEYPGGEGIDGRADLYSLGAVLFEAVAGRRPFEGENPTHLCKMILLDPPPTFRSIGAQEDLPGFEAVIARCLAKERVRRPASAGELLGEIEDLLRGKRRPSPRARLRPLHVAALAGAALCTLGLAWAALRIDGSHAGAAAHASLPAAVAGTEAPVANGPDPEPPASAAVKNPAPANAAVTDPAPANAIVEDPAPANAALPDPAPANVAVTDPSPTNAPPVTGPRTADPAANRPPSAAPESATKAPANPDAPVTGAVRSPVEELRDARLLELWQETRRRAEAALPQGRLPAEPEPYAESRRIVAEFLERNADHPQATAARDWLAQVEREEKAQVEAAWQNSLRLGRVAAKRGDWDRALHFLRVAGAFRPDSEETRTALAEAEAKCAALHDVVVLSHPEVVHGVDFSPDGKQLATACADRQVRIWDLGERKERLLRGHGDAVTDVVFVAQGKRLATAAEDGTVRLWDAATGREWRKLTGPKGKVTALAADARGELLAGAGEDGSVRLWNLTQGKLERTVSFGAEPLADVAVSSDGNVLACVGRRGGAWTGGRDARTGVRALPVLPVVQTCLVFFFPDARQLFTGADDGRVRGWNVASPQPRPPWDGHEGPIRAIAVHSGRSRLATADETGAVWIWDPEARVVVTVHAGHRGAVRALVFSPDGTRLASAGVDASVRVWNVVD